MAHGEPHPVVTLAPDPKNGATYSLAVKSIVHGYNPFIIEAGLYAGAYQGPLYPNPTRLLIEGSEDFDPSPFQDPNMDTFTMLSNTENPYQGLGLGNPGIDHRNFGHLLGMLDTFNRMSFGINIINAARKGLEGAEIGPAVPISFPFVDFEGNDVVLDKDDIYPALSEFPDKYLENIIDGDKITDPLFFMPLKEQEPFIFRDPNGEALAAIDEEQEKFDVIDAGDDASDELADLDAAKNLRDPPYVPETALIEEASLPTDITGLQSSSYFDIIDNLRNTIQDLSDFASAFEEDAFVDIVNSDNFPDAPLTKENFALPLNIDTILPVAGRLTFDFDAPKQTFPSPDIEREIDFFPELEIETSTPQGSFGSIVTDGRRDLGGGTIQSSISNPLGLYKNSCKVMTSLEALEILNGDTFYHDSDELKEYRSLTELNSVINLVPIQFNAMSYKLDTASQAELPPDFDRNQSPYYITFLIADVILNVSRNEPTTINIRAEMTLTNPAIPATTMPSNPRFPCPPDGIQLDASLPEVPESNPESILWRVIIGDFPTRNTETTFPKYSFTQQNVGAPLWRTAFVDRRFDSKISVNNTFTWDREWLGIDPCLETKVQEKKQFFERPGGRRVVDPVVVYCHLVVPAGQTLGLRRPSREYVDQGEPNPSWEPTSTFEIDEAVEVPAGNHVVKARFIAQSVSMWDGTFIVRSPAGSLINHFVDIGGEGTTGNEPGRLGPYVSQFEPEFSIGRMRPVADDALCKINISGPGINIEKSFAIGDPSIDPPAAP